MISLITQGSGPSFLIMNDLQYMYEHRLHVIRCSALLIRSDQNSGEYEYSMCWDDRLQDCGVRYGVVCLGDEERVCLTGQPCGQNYQMQATCYVLLLVCTSVWVQFIISFGSEKY